MDEFSSKKEEFVFWLNTYNLLVVKGVLDKLEKKPDWKGTKNYVSRFNFFAINKFTIGRHKFSLYHIENKILRKKFNDPRIHFAINCGSTSCPVLPESLFNIESVDTLLDEYTINFINNKENVVFYKKRNKIILNPIFKWYKKDFQDVGGVVAFITKYHQDFPSDLKKPKISYSNYNWSLNRQ